MTILEPDDVVRYDKDFDSKAKPRNQQPVPYVLVEEPDETSDFTVYVKWISGSPTVVRAHYGTPYPPFPFNTSAQGWPGYIDDGADEDPILPGVEGCRQFWEEAALCFSNPERFAQMSTTKPDWLV